MQTSSEQQILQQFTCPVEQSLQQLNLTGKLIIQFQSNPTASGGMNELPGDGDLLKLIKVNASKLQFKEKKVVEFRVSCDF